LTEGLLVFIELANKTRCVLSS